MMKKVMLTLALASTLLAQAHTYINGRLVSVSQGNITIDVLGSAKSYRIDSNLRVIKHVMKNRAIYEEPASLSEAKSGMSVTVRVEGNIAKEIILEVYK